MSQLLDNLSRALRDTYIIDREIGEGGMACVFLARELKHDRLVALKVLKPELAQAIGPDRFLREIRVMARLAHPHILPLLDSGNADGQLFYSMPFLAGETLSSRLRREKQLSIDDSIDIAREIASALASAHEDGVIHRDIKPDNVMFEGGQAVVTDFGVASVLRDAGGERLTWTGMSIGTPLYMSPEQASGGETVDERTDIYSLGCVLYEMLTGEPPFTGISAQNILVKRLTDTAPPVRRLRSSTPAWLEEVVQRALQRAPVDRFQTAEEFVRALSVSSSGDVALSSSGARGTIATPTVNATGDKLSTRPRRKWIAAALGVAIVAAIPFAASRFRKADEPAAMAFRQITNEPGAELFPSLRADGAKVVYSRDGDLYLRDVADGSERRLTEQPEFDNRQPAFGPDHRIAFRSERDGGGIFLIDTTGSATVTRIASNGFNPAWSPDGRFVLFANESVDEPSTRRGISNLFSVEVKTGEQKQIGDMDGVQPSWSPNGERIAFWSVMRDGKLSSQRDLWTVAVDGSDAQAVTNDVAVDWNPVWSADGKYLLFSSDRGGAMNIWRIRIDQHTGHAEGEPEAVTTGGTASHGHITVAANGSRTISVERLTTSNIFKIELDPKRGQVVGQPIAVTTGSRMATEPSVSPDGSRIVFYTQSDAMDLYVAGTDGSGLRRLTTDHAKYRSPQWSPDGNSIAFHSDRGGGYQIWSTDAEGKNFRQLTQTGTVTIYPFWSPDGARVGYVDLGRGVSSVPFANPKTGGEMLIAGDLMVRPAWSRDGKRIAGTLPPAAGGTGIVVYSLATREMETISAIGDAPQWLPDSRRVVFAWRDKLYLADVDTRKTSVLLALERDQLSLGSVSRDGRWIYFSRKISEGDLWSMEPKR